MRDTLDPELRARLLEASPDELRALRREHPEHAERIDRLLAANDAIAAALEDRTLSTRGERVPETTAHRALGPTPRVVGLAVAAALAALALWSSDRAPAVMDDATSASREPVQLTVPDLEVETESDFAVFPTRNPDIAVVWLFNGEDR